MPNLPVLKKGKRMSQAACKFLVETIEKLTQDLNAIEAQLHVLQEEGT